MDQKFKFEDGLEIAKLVMPVISPFVQGLIWYGFTRLDKRADALNSLIAFAEILPTVDLNLPKGVVLAALYDKTGDAMKLINDLVQALKEVPSTVKKKVDEITKDIEELIPDLPPAPFDVPNVQFDSDLLACYNNAKNTIPSLAFNSITATTWILSCMLQKGYKVTEITSEAIQRRFF